MSRMVRIFVVFSLCLQALGGLATSGHPVHASDKVFQTADTELTEFVQRLDDLGYFDKLGTTIPLTAVTPSDEQGLRLGGLFDSLAAAIQNGQNSYHYGDVSVDVRVDNGVNRTLVMTATRTVTLPIALSIEDPTSDTPGLCNDAVDNGADGDADSDDPDCTFIGFFLNGGGIRFDMKLAGEFQFQEAEGSLDLLVEPTPRIDVFIESTDIVSFTDQFGFTDVEVSGTGTLDAQIALRFVDPDSDGRITQEEWSTTAIEDLVVASFDPGADDVNVHLVLDSDLVDGAEDGSISLSIDLSENQDWPSATAVNVGYLRPFAIIGPDEMLAGLASYAVGLNTSLLSAEISLPFLEARFSDVFLPGDPLSEVYRQQTDALVICGTTDTLPPTGDPTTAETIYCQAITTVDPQEVTGWSLEDATLHYTGPLTKTVSLSPQANVRFERENTDQRPRVRAEFRDPEGKTHVVFPRVFSAQQLEEELDIKFQELAGGDAGLRYDADNLALMYDISMTISPPVTTTHFAFDDSLRQATNLANLQSVAITLPTLELKDVVVNNTFGAILVDDVAQLAPGIESTPSEDPDASGACDDGDDNDNDGFADEYDPDCPRLEDRFFLGVNQADNYEIQVNDLSLDNVHVELKGNIGFLGVDLWEAAPFSLTKKLDGRPVLGVNILASEGITVYDDSSVSFVIDDAIRIRELLAASGLGDQGHVDRDVNMSMSVDLSVQGLGVPSSSAGTESRGGGSEEQQWLVYLPILLKKGDPSVSSTSAPEAQNISAPQIDLGVQSSLADVGADDEPGGTVFIRWDLSAEAPDISTDERYSTTLRPFDIAPTVAGVHTIHGTDPVTSTYLIDRSRDFLEAFGGGARDGHILNLELFNLSDGSSCTSFQVGAQTLTCVSGLDQNGDPVPVELVGGTNNYWTPGDEYEIRGDPQALGTLILDSLYNLAAQMKGLELENEAKAEFAATLPLIGFSPRDIVDQFDAVATAAVKIKSGAAEAQIVCQPGKSPEADIDNDDDDEINEDPLDGVDNDGDGQIDEDPVENLFCQAFTDVAPVRAAEWSLSEGHGVFVKDGQLFTTTGEISPTLAGTVGISPTDYAILSVSVPEEERDSFRLDVRFTDDDNNAYQATFPTGPAKNLAELTEQLTELLETEFGAGNVSLAFSLEDQVNPATGEPAKYLAAHLEIAAGGRQPYRLRLDLSNGGDSGLELNAIDAFSTALSLDYTSQAGFDIGIPLTTTLSAYDVVVRDTTGVTLTLTAANSNVDIDANLGSVPVTVGKSAVLSGSHTLETLRGIHSSTVVSTTTLIADIDVQALGVVAGAGTILTNTGTLTTPKTATCTVAAINQNVVTCESPLSDGDGAQWEPGDRFELIGPSSKRLHDPDSNFEALNIRVGSIVTNKGTPSNRKDASCEVTHVLTNGLNCEAGLMPANSAWEEGDAYEVSGPGAISVDLTSALKLTRTLPISGFVAGLEHTFSGASGDVISAALAIAQEDGEFIQVLEVAYTIENIRDGVSPPVPGALGAAVETAPMDWTLLPAALPFLSTIVDENLDGMFWNFGLPLVGYDLGAGVNAQDIQSEVNRITEELSDRSSGFPSITNDITGTLTISITQAVISSSSLVIADSVRVNILCPDGNCANIDDVQEVDVQFILRDNLNANNDNPQKGCANCDPSASPEVVPFGVGLPGLPLEPQSDQDQVQSQVGWRLTVAFGLSREDGPYLRVDGEDELLIGAKVTIAEGCSVPKPDILGNLDPETTLTFSEDRCLDAVMGFLPGTVFDGDDDPLNPSTDSLDDDQSYLDLLTTLDLGNGASGKLTYGQLLDRTAVHTVTVDADANVDLAFKADFDESSLDILPIVGTFHLEFHTDGPVRASEGVIPDWIAEPRYDHLYVNVSSFFGNFLGPLVDDVQDFTAPLQPPIDVLNAPVPVISNLSQALGQGSLSMLTLLEAVSGNDLTLIRRLGGFVTFVNNLPADNTGVWIALGVDPGTGSDAPGDFSISVEDTLAPPCYEDELEGWLEGKVPPCEPDNSIEKNWEKIKQGKTKSGRQVTQKWQAGASLEYTAGGISLPFLTDSRQIYGMLMGIDATLLRVDFGSLTGKAGISYSYYTVFVTAIGPIPVEFIVGGEVSVTGRFAIGYDTRGLRHALAGESFTGEALLDGIFLDDYDADGNEVPELSFTARFYAGAAVSIRIIKVGVELGVSFTVNLDLNDPNNDGKMYIDEIMLWRFNPICLFEFSGSLGFFMRFFVEIDLWLFTARAEWYPFKADIPLFSVKCEPPKPVLGGQRTVHHPVDGEEIDVFALNMGPSPYVQARNFRPDVTKEKFTVRQLTPVGGGCGKLPEVHEYGQQPGQPRVGPSTDCSVPITGTTTYSGTWISVAFQGIKQSFFLPDDNVTGTKTIYADAGSDNDVIRLVPGSDSDGNEVPFTLHAIIFGGPGDDRISTGYGNDVIYGDDGNDVINSGWGDDTIQGGTGDDKIDSGANDDVLYGDSDSGTSCPEGKTCNDILNGGPGMDALHGGPGDDRITGGPGLSSSFEVVLQDRNDILVGGSGGDELEGDFGDHNYLFGDDLPPEITIEQLRGQLLSPTLLISDTLVNSLDGMETCNGSEGCRDVLTGGDGQDYLFGGPDNDVLAGGRGDDHLWGNSGHDKLDGSRGDDVLYGGSGDDQLFGWSGHDMLVGGIGNDLLRGGTDSDDLIGDLLLQNGDEDGGTDALVGDAGQDIMLGDSGVLTEHISVTHSAHLTEVLALISLEQSPISGTVTCALRVQVEDGRVDVNGDGDVDQHDIGFFEGFPVIQMVDDPQAGAIDINMDGFITQADTGFIYEILVQEGLVDVNGDGQANQDDDGTVLGLAMAGSGRADCIYGGEDDDYLFGGPGDDWMFGDAGADYLEGNGGGDTVRGGQDDDLMYGDDSYTGPDGAAVPPQSPGADFMFGDSGDDRMYGNAGGDAMRGGIGDDTMEGNADADWMYGDADQDDMIGGTSTPNAPDDGDTMFGNAGDDVMAGDNARISQVDRSVTLFDLASGNEDTDAAGGDTMHGDDGDDRMYGGAEIDTMYGDADDDTMEGNGSGDWMWGGADQDDMIGGSSQGDGGQPDGADQMYGDDGDTDAATNGDGGDVMAGDNARITRRGNAAGQWAVDPNTGDALRDVVLFDIEVAGGSPIDPMTSGSDRMFGEGGRDFMFGQGNDASDSDGDGRFNEDPVDGVDNDRDGWVDEDPGGDEMHGGPGPDTMEGNHGSDWMFGEDGEDDMIGGSSAGPDGIVGSGAPPTDLSDGDDVMRGGGEDDVMLGDNALIERQVDGGGIWLRHAGYGFDVVARTMTMSQTPERPGAYGDDDMRGNDGHDDMVGQLGDDYMEGNDGEDAMVGDLGRISGNVEDGGREQVISVPAPFFEETIYQAGTFSRQVALYAFLEKAGGEGDDTMLGGPGQDRMHGGPGNDIMNGNADRDRVFGGDGQDVLWGGPDHDHLWGGYQEDYLDVRPRPASGENSADPAQWFTYGEPDNYQGLDLIYGGWHRDALQADVAAPGPQETDRLIDWAGGYNVFYVCQAPYGEGTITRQSSPHLQGFLQDLAEADGAVAVAEEGSSGFRELGYVFPNESGQNSHEPHPDHPGHFSCWGID